MLLRLTRYLRISIFLIILTQAAPSAVRAQQSLWVVESPTNTVYLLGSLHMLKPSHYPLAKSLEDAFSDSRHLVTEANLDEMESSAVMGNIMMKAMYTDGSTLQTSVSPETYQLTTKATEAFQGYGVNMQVFNGLKPWFVAITIVGLKLQQLGFDPANGVDRYFFNKAKAASMGLHALETSNFQINLLSSLSKKNQELMLLQTIRDLEVTEQLFDEIYVAWRDGNVTNLDKLLTESFKEYPAVYQKLIVDRNQNWVPQIESFLEQDENYLVVVGAGHLVGDKSVVRMLQMKGYTVRQK